MLIEKKYSPPKRKDYIMLNLLKLIPIAALCFSTAGYATKSTDQLQEVIDSTIRPMMQEYAIPGVAVAVTINGKRYFYNYGLESKATKQPITSNTLFEIGSISKTFTATLASYAQENGNLSLSDKTSQYLPALQGSHFDNITLINLGTHTAGGLPLQVPDDINDMTQLMSYLQRWEPKDAAGTHRAYSNVSIGLLGMIAAKSMNKPFNEAMEKGLFADLGMKNSYINVPVEKMPLYAQGYNKKDEPVRVNPGVLADEAYGVKTSTADIIQFIDANMYLIKTKENLHRAIDNTHTGYFTSGELTQDLIWEQYAYPVTLKRLLAGNSDTMSYGNTPATQINPPLSPQQDVWINKTGSTNGFAAYVAFIPAQKVGIVILANKNYPIPARVTAAHKILTDSRVIESE